MIRPMKGLTFYRDVAGLWRWKLTAHNGKRIHSSKQGFANKRNAREHFVRTIDTAFQISPVVNTQAGPRYE